MKKKSKIILGVCIVAAALIGMSVWNTWFSPTKIAFINFQTIQQGSISKANDNSSIKLSEVSLDNLDRLTGYDMVFINGMGLRIVEEQRQQIQQAADKGIPVYTSMATNPANNICNLDSVQQNLIRGYLTNGGKTNYRNMLNYIRKAIDGKISSIPEVEGPAERSVKLLTVKSLPYRKWKTRQKDPATCSITPDSPTRMMNWSSSPWQIMRNS